MKNNSLEVTTKCLTYVFFALFVLIPTMFIFLTAFLKADSLGNIEFVFTIENFRKLLDPTYIEVLLNSVKISFVTTVLTFIIAYPLAYVVAKLRSKFKFILLLLIIMPYWTNSLVRTYSFLIILRADGFINQFLMFLRVIEKPIQLLYTEGSVIAAMVYLFLPIMFLPIFSSVSKFDYNYIEAARDLGGGRFRVFIDIVFPLTLPGVVAGIVMVFTPSLGLFFVADLIGGGKVVMLGNIIHDQFSVTRNMPFGAAISALMMLLALIFIAIYYKILLSNSIEKE